MKVRGPEQTVVSKRDTERKDLLLMLVVLNWVVGLSRQDKVRWDQLRALMQ